MLVEDILRADAVVLTVPEPELLVATTISAASRGGRTFESGLVYGLILAQWLSGERPTRELIILGKKENVFHYLDGEGMTSRYPVVQIMPTWEEVKGYLMARTVVPI